MLIRCLTVSRNTGPSVNGTGNDDEDGLTLDLQGTEDMFEMMDEVDEDSGDELLAGSVGVIQPSPHRSLPLWTVSHEQ